MTATYQDCIYCKECKRVLRQCECKPELKTRYKYIRFYDISNNFPSRKTKTLSAFSVLSMSASNIGVVKWYAPWRQYCFYPANDTVFNKGCLEDTNHFITQLMEARK